MTYEEKDFLLKDLCARLPYGVTLMNIYGEKRILKTINYEFGIFEVENEDSPGNYEQASILTWKPCLRPISSMTDDEFDELTDIVIPIDGGKAVLEEEKVEKYLEFMYSHHFDYRGLIDKGLAIELK